MALFRRQCVGIFVVVDVPFLICGGTPRKGSIEFVVVRVIINADILRNKHA